MKVLIGCERFGVLRDAFAAAGHDAWSCDLVPAGGQHIRGDVRQAASKPGWDLFIVHPDCTFLTVANTYINRGCSKYTPEKAIVLRDQACEFFMECVALCERIGKGAIENPVGIMSTRYRKPDQVVQPWQYGDDASKGTCLWIFGLPTLVPTNVLPGGRSARRANQTAGGQNRLGPSHERAMLRAKTYPGIAKAMAAQWGSL